MSLVGLSETVWWDESLFFHHPKVPGHQEGHWNLWGFEWQEGWGWVPSDFLFYMAVEVLNLFFVRVFFWSPSIGKQRFFQIIPWWFAWKPRTPVKGKGSERSYFYIPVEVDKKRQKLLLTSEGSCCFTGKKTTPISVEKFVVETNMCHFFLHWKHFLVSLCFGIVSYFFCSFWWLNGIASAKNPPSPRFSIPAQGLAWINHCSGLTKMGDFQEVCWPRVVLSYSGGASCSCIFGKVEPRFLNRRHTVDGWNPTPPARYKTL